MRLLLLPLVFCIASSAASAAVSGPDLSGNPAPLTVAPGPKGTVAVFLSTKCPCSASHLATLKQLVRDFPGFAFVVIHSNADETAAEARAYFDKAGLGLPVIQDAKAKLADELRALKTPHAFVLSPAGDVLYRGGITNSENAATADKQLLRAALDDVVAGRAVREPSARTLGCVIAR